MDFIGDKIYDNGDVHEGWIKLVIAFICPYCILPAILGIHGMLSQNQSRYAENVDAGKSLKGSGLKKYKPGKTTDLNWCPGLQYMYSSFLGYAALVILLSVEHKQ